MNLNTCPVCGSTAVSADGLVSAKGPQVTFPDGSRATLAGWWRRVGATFADNLILFIPTELIQAFFIAISGGYIAAVLTIGAQGIYFIQLLKRERAQTIGNRIANTKVVDATTGAHPTVQQIWKRWGFVAIYSIVALALGYVGLILAGVVSIVDFLLPLFDKQNQTLHDKFANTLVVLAS